MNTRGTRAAGSGPGLKEGGDQGLDGLLAHVARGDRGAFEAVYDRFAGPVYGLILKVVRDPAQSEEVAQEVMLEVWRTAARFDASKGTAATWILTIAHRRAIDRVRSVTASAQREQRIAAAAVGPDEVADTVAATLDRERVRRCLDGLTSCNMSRSRLPTTADTATGRSRACSVSHSARSKPGSATG